jgi:DNA-binding transcriptional ArsR family regulator
MMEAEIFKALADPTRRAVFEKLAGGGRNATELRAGLPISQPAMSQHLGVLREAGLIREARAGRTVTYTMNPEGLAPLRDWLERYGAFWPARIDALKGLLKEMDQ